MIEYVRHYEVLSKRATLVDEDRASTPAQLILGGYSYGSWICTHLPSADELYKQFVSPSEGSAASEVKTRALHLATQTFEEMNTARQETKAKHSHTRSIGGEETPSETRHHSGEDSPNKRSVDLRKSLDFAKKIGSVRKKHHGASSLTAEETEIPEHENTAVSDFLGSKVDVAYLLVSPLLPPISAFTTLPFGTNALKAHPEDGLQQLSSYPSLAIFGSDDMFTSGKKLRNWAQEIANRPASQFQFVEVDEAGHFWRTAAAQKSLRIGIREWIRGLSGTPTTDGPKVLGASLCDAQSESTQPQ